MISKYFLKLQNELRQKGVNLYSFVGLVGGTEQFFKLPKRFTFPQK